MSGRREKKRRRGGALVPQGTPEERAERLAEIQKERASLQRILNMEAAMLEYLRDEDAEPNEVFNVCVRIAAKQAMRGQRGQLWFLQQARIVWNAQAKIEKGAR